MADNEGYVHLDGGLRLYYRVIGGSEAVVIPAATWLAADLEPLPRGRRLIFYDRRGRGRSMWTQMSHTFGPTMKRATWGRLDPLRPGANVDHRLVVHRRDKRPLRSALSCARRAVGSHVPCSAAW